MLYIVMKYPVAREYIDKLLASNSFDALVQLDGYFCADESFDERARLYGLPPELFIFVQVLYWTSVSTRSGIWTYYEAVPQSTQDETLACLKTYCSVECADMYAYGMKNWESEEPIRRVDSWIADNESILESWAFSHLSAHKPSVYRSTKST